MESTTKDALLGDPLGQETRKSRTFLLAVSTLSVAIVRTGLTPTRITALGIEFGKADQKAILGMLGIMVGYFLVAFMVYAGADFLAWRRTLMREVADQMREWMRGERGATEAKDWEIEREIQRRLSLEERGVLRFAGPTAKLRVLFELFLPVAVGLYALFVLLTRIPRI